MLKKIICYIILIQIVSLAHGDNEQIVEKLKVLRNGHIIGIHQIVMHDQHRFVIANYDLGHEYCDINALFISKDN